MKQTRKRALIILFGFVAMIELSSCTAIRDTTPCNNSAYLKLSEKQDLTEAETKLLDSLHQRCIEYTEYRKNNPVSEDEHQSAGWWGVGVVVVALLAFLYFGGIFG